MNWLRQISERIAARCGRDSAALSVAPDQARELLELAGIAAHTSGNRTNAPLLCYVLGLAVGRGAALSELAKTVHEAANANGPGSSKS